MLVEGITGRILARRFQNYSVDVASRWITAFTATTDSDECCWLFMDWFGVPSADVRLEKRLMVKKGLLMIIASNLKQNQLIAT